MELRFSVNSKEPESLRETINLHGEWEFQMDPDDVGRKEGWYDRPFDRKIQVPGAWNAQGMGYDDDMRIRVHDATNVNSRGASPEMLGRARESEKLHHVFLGPAWYRRVVRIPPEWEGRVCSLRFEGIHRYAEVWINGCLAGTHSSYLSPLRIDLSGRAKANEEIIIAVRVDARWKREVDPLLGCLDTLDFLFVTWGGIYGNVVLEATAPAWIEDIFVLPCVPEQAAVVRLTFAGALSANREIGIEMVDADSNTGASLEAEIEAGAGGTGVYIPISNVRLWSPLQPHLYTARVILKENGVVVDSRSVRFGMRELVVKDGEFLLNGKPIFLRGYGDDAIFPKTIAPPMDREEYRKRLLVARDYGFNYVRHHSWFPPEEYFEVADELGMMVQPELPIAYSWTLPATAEQEQVLAKEWELAIRRYRNHPSVVTWGMGNELYKSFPLAPELYRRAKEIDPTRLVIDSDGFGLGNDQDRDTLDFWVAQFDEASSCGFQSSKYQLLPGLKKPVVAHEAGYFVTLPRLDQADCFGNGLRPYWLTQARKLAEQNGVAKDYPRWVERSERLQAICLKSNFEAARLSRLSGYSHWLFQDYPNCAEGVVDMFFRPKSATAVEFRKFNAPTVLLMETSGRNYYFGETANIQLLVSRFEEEPSSEATLEWELRAGADTLVSGKKTGLAISSDGLQELASLSIQVPSRPSAAKLTLVARLVESDRTTMNDWKFWSFPRRRNSAVPVKRIASDVASLANIRTDVKMESTDVVSPGIDLLLTAQFHRKTLDYLAGGRRVVLFAPEQIFSTEPTRFRLAAWDGGGSSGTEIATAHPAFCKFPHEGWCDLHFFSLIEGSKSVLLDDLSEKIEPIVRFIDRPQRLSNRAYLFEASVGSGKLLVCGFNPDAAAKGDPAAEYFFSCLVDYALSSEFAPVASLMLQSLRDRLEKQTETS